MKTCNATNLNACLPTRALTCSNENKKQQPFDTHHCSIIYCLSHALKVTRYNTFQNFTSHTSFLFSPSHLQPACLYKPVSCRQTPLTCCEQLPTATLTISKSNWEKFTLAFPFFFSFYNVQRGSCYGDGIQRQLWQPMYTSGKSIEVGFVNVLRTSVVVCPA